MNIQIILLIISIILYITVSALMYKKIINQRHKIKHFELSQEYWVNNENYIEELEEKNRNLEYNKKEMEKLYYQLLNASKLTK